MGQGDPRRQHQGGMIRRFHTPIRELEWRVRQRIGSVIRAYGEQGFHRTGTDVDRMSGDWLANEVRQIGLEPALEEFSLSRVDPVGASLVVNGRQIEGLPFFDGAFTSPAGIAGPWEASIAMHRSGLPKFHRTPQRPVHWEMRAGKIDIRPSSSSPAGRAPDFARAMPRAFCVRLVLRCCRLPARKRRSLPIARDRARRPC